MRSIELFAGAGGLALGCERAGFRPELVVEWDKWACDTIRENKAAGHPLVSTWAVHQGDVREVDWNAYANDIALISGGPPCQPFSLGGKSRAFDDTRNMFPAALAAIEAVRPKAFLIENVRGLARKSFADYLEYLTLRLTYMQNPAGSDWSSDLATMTQWKKSGLTKEYGVVRALVNAANYGIPQQRHRIFFVGFRNDQELNWVFPEPTHTLDALLVDQWVTGQYWDRHEVARNSVPDMPSRFRRRVDALRVTGATKGTLPWRTVRDALVGLPEAGDSPLQGYKNHVAQKGARSYPGHTGSELDLPAKALKAGSHGVPGGENMMRTGDNVVRYFTVRESARLQTFPDDYELHGSWGEAMRQLGNAVPVELARKIAESVYSHLSMNRDRVSEGNEKVLV